ncbi:MAG: ImmA/IrrE family metallo-endopeptidase [Alphaproteobacteria bacterium]|nr:ImmA/IrrE family metallo-endopeptidase [Alphaproteobacteria bacterium]MDE2074247.1 ImmA/IrrE family metallo-endopeptidase [Alphaproteobacteria bacterium]MDE2352986.1 ImmA/IrrE family metallo-endopeptidase [Alphaproteobacteria bacterium]
MDRSQLKAIKCYFIAQMINHYYWVHTDGDDPTGKISIENVERIVTRLSGLQIKKFSVPFEGKAVQGNVERNADRTVRIHIREDQTEGEMRFTAIKELFHLIADDNGDFSTNVVKAIGDLVKYQQRALDGQASDELRAERAAEVFALEIIYPFEHRDSDQADHKAGTPLDEIAKKRGVPLYWVRRALTQSHLDRSRKLWGSLPVNVEFPPLPKEGEIDGPVISVEEVHIEDETEDTGENNGGK